MNGVFCVNKPSGPSSAEVVAQLKTAINASILVEGSEANTGGPPKKKKRRGGKQWWKNKQNQDVVKVGHGGTLDPLASGVMVVGVGEGTRKLTSFLTDCTKTYEAVAMFGVSTDTYDSTGKILEHGATSHLTIDNIKNAIKEKFTGEILQFPPIYSALKMNGKPLYEYAREGLPLPKQIESRKVEVSYFEVVNDDLDWNQTEYQLPVEGEASAEEKEFILKQGQEMLKHVDSNDLAKLTSSVTTEITEQQEETKQDSEENSKKYPTLTLRFSVSSGTYIRSLIHDLAKAVGSTAHMTKLVRIQQGPFKLGFNAFDVDSITKADDAQWVPLVKLAIAEGPDHSIAELQKKLKELAVTSVLKTKPATEKKIEEKTEEKAEKVEEKTEEKEKSEEKAEDNLEEKSENSSGPSQLERKSSRSEDTEVVLPSKKTKISEAEAEAANKGESS